jgi:hypothetical protein
LRRIPGQQFVDPIDRVLADAGEEIAQIGFGLDAVELGGADDGIEDRSSLASFASA